MPRRLLRHAGVAALTTAATLLALSAAIGPLFYPQPRLGRWTLETELRFFAPLFAPFAGASLAHGLLGGGGTRRTIVAGALATLGLVVGLRTRPWDLWAGTTTMARANALWVAGAVFAGALLGSLAAARSRRVAEESEEGSKEAVRVRRAAHLAVFAATLAGVAMLSGDTRAVEIALLALSGAGAVLALVGPYRRLGAEAVRLAATLFLGWLAGVLWRETAGR